MTKEDMSLRTKPLPKVLEFVVVCNDVDEFFSAIDDVAKWLGTDDSSTAYWDVENDSRQVYARISNVTIGMDRVLDKYGIEITNRGQM